jgi:hypothetical protein
MHNMIKAINWLDEDASAAKIGKDNRWPEKKPL